jgi:Dolichyl-phosphate-mannose-protein mannosyltransferase
LTSHALTADLADTLPRALTAPADPATAWHGRHAARPGARDRLGTGPLLIAILTVQAVLSLRLVWSNTAFLDEATYLFAGHVELMHWLHGTPAPAYATYFSGSPAIYPPLAAAVASAGGLAATRLLSLAFMLATTALLWGTTSMLFGRRAAVAAAALFAVLGPTQFLGAFATYDAMALFLLSASAWCVVRARDRDDSTLLLVAGALLLALSNATKYATGLFDPTVIALGALTIARRCGAKAAIGRGGYLTASALGLISALLALGGSSYLTGILSTTVARTAGGQPPRVILTDSAHWIGLAFVASGLGVALCLLSRDDRVQAMILAVLAVSGVLAPLNQARIHTLTSLSKHVDFGAWFAAAAAGYAIARLSRLPLRRPALRAGLAGLAGLALIVPAGIIGWRQATSFYQDWPDSAQVTADLSSITRAHPGRYLAEDYDVPAYYLENTVTWQQWSDTWYLSYQPPGARRPLTGPAAYRAAVQHHYFTLIILDFGDTAQVDSLITSVISASGDYRVIAELPYWDKFGTGRFTVWAYEPPAQRSGKHAGSRAERRHAHR